MPPQMLPPVGKDHQPHSNVAKRHYERKISSEPSLTADRSATRDLEVSPGSAFPNSHANSASRSQNSQQTISPSIAPWETSGPIASGNQGFGGHRKEKGGLGTVSRTGVEQRMPTTRQQPPTVIQPLQSSWNSQHGRIRMPTSVFGSFYNDSSEDVGQISPGFRPGSSQEEMDALAAEGRRPSVASATTVSSHNSKSSMGRNIQKRLHGFFGDEFPGADNANQDPILPTGPMAGSSNMSAQHMAKSRHVSSHTSNFELSRPSSPSSMTRPYTSHATHASSEVTPWEFQDLNNKELPPPPNQSSNSTIRGAKPTNYHHHRLHLPGHGHRQTRSKDEPWSSSQDFAPDAALRPALSREGSVTSHHRLNDFNPSYSSATSSVSNLAARATSPSPSAHSSGAMEQKSSPMQPHSGKRSLLDKFRGKVKHDKQSSAAALPLRGASLSTSPQPKYHPGKLEIPAPNGKRKGDGASIKKSSIAASKEVAGKSARLPFMTTKKDSYQQALAPLARDPNLVEGGSQQAGGLWNLDSDLTNMEGIINTKQPMTPPVGASEIFTGWPEEKKGDAKDVDPDAGAWDAPDSWAVKKVADENLTRMKELDEDGLPLKDENVGPPYCVRIFRADSTFAVLSVSLNTTVAEIVALIGKKTFLMDDLENYHVVMKKHDTSRQLEPNERPLVIQKRLLEQAGYVESDRIEEVGREDNSYLCRFTFLPAKMTGYSSLDRDPGFSKMQKFSHIDLQGRNLINIPITLYQKATEIISLNLSRNLSLDVPKDFIQVCSNLREIKYTSNEAWKLPPSLALASRLTMLDVSNNRLEQLDHANLGKLQSLISLRLSNNKISVLPKYFGQYKSLRSLNLSSNLLTSYPDYMCELETLVDLDISFNAISELPQIGKLKSLERLWATNNKLSGPFPYSASRLTNLRELDVRFNAIDNIDIISQLSKLEYLMVGNNNITGFEGTFNKIRVFHLNNNPVTRFGFSTPVPTLSNLNIERAKLAALPDDLFQKIPNLTKLCLDKNHFVSISPHIGKLTKLEHLSIAQNMLSSLPPEIGRLSELRFLDLRENNLSSLPSQIWFAKKLETLNLSTNVLGTFPKPGAPMPALPETQQAATPGGPPHEGDELGRLEDFYARRPSHASNASSYLSVGSGSPANSSRKGSVASIAANTTGANRRPSLATTSRASEGTITPISRKDSSMSNRMLTTFAGSLRHLYLADNRLQDEVFDELALLPELRILNLSYNLLYDMPPRTLRRWTQLVELHLSGNDFTSLPAEDLEEVSLLKVLMLNNNKFQVLPAELAKVQKLAVMDVGSNMLKYNVSNWPYDWNWNWNHNLKYLNMSGNKRLEIKPIASAQRGSKDLTDFTCLKQLRILGLMDVTLMVQSWPDQTEDRRVRTAGSMVGQMAYGMADYLGRNDHLSTIDMVMDRFRGHDDEVIIGMFDGQALPTGGSKIAKYLYENFKNRFQDELERLRGKETPSDALRRTYLSLNKDVAIAAGGAADARTSSHRGSIAGPELGEEDLHSGCVATVLYIKEMTMYISNVGDATALLVQSDQGFRVITTKHDPADPGERARIREAGGFVSRHGKLNDALEVSRAFGYIHMSPAVIAAPHVSEIQIKETDEMVLVASRELWRFLSRDFVVDMARSERKDLMRAAQKIRDLAIAFGASDKLMVMILGVSDLKKRDRARYRTHSMSMGPSGQEDEYFSGRRRRAKEQANDAILGRLDREVDAPTGDVSLVFTDIKSSTLLWETYPIAMRTCIKMHNDLMRRQLRIIGGYEVKTEGDAFMVAFPTVTSALLWCFTIQMQLLEADWPQEILNSVNGQEVLDADGNVIFRGLSVRMGIHWGAPVCEIDPVTKRMDYFGPMVNRTSRISSVADGGQITVSSDFIAEIQRLLETHIESDRTPSTGSEDTMEQDAISSAIRRELRALSSQGFEVKDLGEKKLKGLENPEYIYLMYPHALSSRLTVQQQVAAHEVQGEDGAAVKTRESQLTIDVDNVWGLWNVSLRLEMLCSTLECPGMTALKPPETAMLERMKERGGEITDHFLINFLEHQVSRIESCINTLALRNMVRPFQDGLLNQACPMDDIFAALTEQLSELKLLKESAGAALEMGAS